MKKISIKNIYLLLIISIGLIVLGVGSTFAMFTASAEINNPVTVSSELEYEGEIYDAIDVVVEGGQRKKITMNVSNNSSQTLYYAFWYINNGNNDIDIEINDPNGGHNSIGNIASGAATKTYSVLIVNNDRGPASLTLGVLSGNSETFNLGTGMNLIPGEELTGGVNEIYNIYTPNSSVTEGNDVVDSVDTVNHMIEDSNGNVRYYGENPNNYIKFNCDAYPSTNCETWRIIGVVDGRVKLIRNGSIGQYSWDTSSSSTNSGNGINEWSQSAAKMLLNPGSSGAAASNSLYYYSKSGNCYSGASSSSSACDFTTENPQSGKYQGLKNNNTDIIAYATYYLGASNSYGVYPNYSLTQERGTLIISSPDDGVTRKTTWSGKVGIPYPSDYAYASDLTSCTSTLTNYAACSSTNWMYNIMTTSGTKRAWFITPNTTYQYRAWGLTETGQFGTFSTYGAESVVPVVYLDSSIFLDLNHAGTSSDPYTLYIKDFAYTGNIQSYTIPKDGKYSLEVWGASGGYVSTCGPGGYAKGEIELDQDDVLYAVVGGQGAEGVDTFNPGGYNGGGYGGRNTSTYYGYGGGGATHIATRTGLLSSLESYQSDILIVAGGGGGGSAGLTTFGGGGGGYIGGMGTSSSSYNTSTYLPTGGTQTGPGYAYDTTVIRHGSFGTASQVSNNGAYGGGGGGGFYAGGTGFGTTGSGGSGYIGNPLLTNKVMYCYRCGESSAESTKTISTENNSSLIISNCPKNGNGYARIIFIK